MINWFKKKIAKVVLKEVECPTCLGMGWAGHWYNCCGCGGTGKVNTNRVFLSSIPTTKYLPDKTGIWDYRIVDIPIYKFKEGFDKIETLPHNFQTQWPH